MDQIIYGFWKTFFFHYLADEARSFKPKYVFFFRNYVNGTTFFRNCSCDISRNSTCKLIKKSFSTIFCKPKIKITFNRLLGDIGGVLGLILGLNLFDMLLNSAKITKVIKRSFKQRYILYKMLLKTGVVKMAYPGYAKIFKFLIFLIHYTRFNISNKPYTNLRFSLKNVKFGIIS